jgi:predicted XRE-type DNA-binding protein
MTSTITPLNDERITLGSGNIFLDLGFDPAEAHIMQMRAEVMLGIELKVKSLGWTQLQTAKQLGITQPRVSKLLKGVWQDFSLDMLLTLAARAGMRTQLTVV